ncbi:MAG: ABC transporter ATP-binding protein [Rhodothermaceae bacterium]|nr:ABC transporter ATP-binding protein [Rhodothermaceae bacterium]
MIRLDVEGISKRFIRRLLFKELSFTLEGGRSLAITGSNGSGKSTLLRIIAGVMTPNKGKVALTVDGIGLEGNERPLHVGFVAPYFNVYEGFSARENLDFVAKVRRIENPKDRIEEVFSLVSLQHRSEDLVKTYSSGMKQRLKLGVSILTNPPLLLLDEPTTTLDLAGIDIVRKVMKNQVDRGGLLIMATNNPEEVSWCDSSLSIEDFRKRTA